jgi:hypothetical protein
MTSSYVLSKGQTVGEIHARFVVASASAVVSDKVGSPAGITA